MKILKRIFVAIIILSFFSITGYFIYLYRDLVIELFEEPAPPKVVEEYEIEYDQTYITETSYDGTKEVHPALFSVPFKRTDAYICNRELIETVPKENLERISIRAQEIAEELFNTNFADVSTDYDKKKKSLEGIFQLSGTYINDSGEWFDVNGFIADYLKDISDSGLQAVASFETDSCMVYQDTIYYVRGLLTLEVISIDDTEGFRNYLNVSLEEGHTYQIIYEIGVAPYSGIKNNNGDYKDSREPESMRMSSFEIIKVISNSTQKITEQESSSYD